MKRCMILALAFLLASVMIPAGLAGADSTTAATISFVAGGLMWGDLEDGGLDDMELAFGERTLPGDAVEYPMTNTNRKIVILDARETPNGWRAEASLSTFDSDSGSFDGMITLKDGTSTNEYLTIGSSIELTSGASETRVVTASAESPRGTSEVIWNTTTQITLSLSATEARKTVVDDYTATITWLLLSGPA